MIDDQKDALQLPWTGKHFPKFREKEIKIRRARHTEDWEDDDEYPLFDGRDGVTPL